MDKSIRKKLDFNKYPRRKIALMFLYFGWEYDGLVTQADTLNTVEEVCLILSINKRIIIFSIFSQH